MLRIAQHSAAPLLSLAAASLAGRASTAVAATYCVTCDEPQARYACSVDAPPNAGLQLYCMSELAKAGHHARCTISRGEQSTCGGDVRTLAAPQGLLGQPALSAAPKDAAAGGTPEQPPTQPEQDADALKQKNQQPKTVQEIIEKSGGAAVDGLSKTGEAAVDVTEQTGGVLQNAGNSIAGAAKKTWTCVVSLFGDC